ncbi:hypothetical protein DL89DRAFT_265722 [Linderina pennispora]|uniref:Uncharacterized protein n=1 Tax=Linderina pennispora TaxID=61395 RepID=A0A1Y1WF14_9FUNG|nr:uncharacterized protein DL89DRAFT_265722 [Linderina pennispora]ORX72062.1 hypothetical protein DL89DRAFT_265722 [Linderina pennispora]
MRSFSIFVIAALLADVYADAGDDYPAATAPYAGDDETTTVVLEGESPCEPVVTPYVQTVVANIVNTVVAVNTVYEVQTNVQQIQETVTNVQMAGIAEDTTELYQVTQMYVCPPPATVTVDEIQTLWVTETVTPTVQVVETQYQQQVVQQVVTATQQVNQVAYNVVTVQQQAAQVVATNVHPVVQVVQENVQQVPYAAGVPYAGAVDCETPVYA